MKKRHTSKEPAGQVRIIGGEWRSRKVSFPERPGLRPTPDRVRETLFNWLAFRIAGTRVLDPFAGSGALIFEALSRGANEVLAFELDPAVLRALRANLETLGSSQAQLLAGDALQHLRQSPVKPYNLVFLDPPFHQQLLEKACTLLENGNWLSNDALIYTESELSPSAIKMPDSWHLSREKKAGQVYYSLWQRKSVPNPEKNADDS